MTLTASGPELSRQNGEVWRWNPSTVATAVAPPTLVNGQVIWLTEWTETVTVCPFCGQYQNQSFELRDGQAGQILWLARQGVGLTDLPAALEQELFGVAVTTVVACQQAGSAACYSLIQRDTYDHVLATTPAQTVHHAVRQTVMTPNGGYDLLWATSQDQGYRDPNCADGPGVAHDTAFAASRLVP